MSIFRKYNHLFGIEPKNEQPKNDEWLVVSTYLFKNVYSGDRIKLQVNDKVYFGKFKFYLHSISEVAITVNGEEVIVYIEKPVVASCYLAIKDTLYLRRAPVIVEKLSDNPNDFNKKI
jgi:PHD/YefM family antitoxin component YafN of YafNO toxin-antitoxin module